MTTRFITEVVGNMYSYCIIFLSFYHVPDFERAHSKCSLNICGEEGRKKGREGGKKGRREKEKKEKKEEGKAR